MPETRKQKIESPEAPGAIGPYSPAIKSDAGSHLFVSGQMGIDPETGEFVSEEVAGQAEQCLKNLMALVGSAGGSQASVVKVNIYLQSIKDFAAVNEVYARFFEEPYPARACIGGCELPKGALVEIEAIAAV
jgi:2-iminobutanoate/2-iminopropanoate deaminase